MLKKRVISGVVALFAVVFSAQQGNAADVVKLSPEKAVELAKTQSIAVRASRYNVKAQEKAVKSVAAGFLPTLSASASAMHFFNKPQMALDGGGGSVDTNPIINALTEMFSNMKIETPYNIYNLGLNVAQPVFTGGKLLNGYRVAKFGLEVQKFTYGRTVTEIGLSAQKFFWGYVGAVKGLEALSETRQWFETLVKDQQKMYDNGLIIELDVLNSRIQLDNFKLAEEKMNNTIRTVADQLLLFLGLAQGSVIDADTSLLAGSKSVPASTDSVDQLVDKRDDLRAMSSQISALKALKGLTLGSYWPTIAAFGSYGTSNQSSIKESDMQLSSSVGVQLSWTLLDWGKTWNDAQKVELQMEAAKLQADNTREMVKLKYFELSRKVDESIKSCDIAREDLETAQKALKIAKLKYDAQAITNTELLNARNQLTGKIVAYTQARINVILATEEFKVAPLGGTQQQ
jgi:outer membrane protein TolC